MAKNDKTVKNATHDLGSEIYTRYTGELESSHERLKNYAEWKKWFEGDEDLMFSSDRQDWKPRVIANLLESTVRTKVSLLTDSKPKVYVYAIPGIEEITDPEAKQRAKDASLSMNNGFDHIWRYNRMHSVGERIILNAAQTGLLSARSWFDKDTGEVLCEAIHPRYVFFDDSITNPIIIDGSAECMTIAIPKPITWLLKHFPENKKDIQEVESSADLEIYEDSRYQTGKWGMYIESYRPFSQYDVEMDESGDWKASGKPMVTKMCGRNVLSNEPAAYFPITIGEYEFALDSGYGTGDIARLIAIQKDFNSKISQISMNIALSANRQYIVNPAKLGMKVSEFLEHSGEAGYVFVTKKLAEDVKNAIIDLETPKFNPSLFQYIYFLPGLFEWVSGTPKSMQGMPAKAERMTRLEAGKVYESAATRIRNVAHHIEQFYTDMGTLWIKLIQQYIKEPKKLYSFDAKMNQGSYQAYSNPDNQYDFILTVQPDSVLPIDLQSQAERDLQLAQMKVIDPQTVLESLNHPKADQVIQRMQAANAQQPPQAPPGGAPAAPESNPVF